MLFFTRNSFNYMKKILFSALSFSLTLSISTAIGPSEMRKWKSAEGAIVEAQAIAYADGKVTLKNANGKSGKTLISKLSEEDQAFIKDYFTEEEAPIEQKVKKEKMQFGKVKGPILAGKHSSGGDSSYYYYVPTTAMPDTKVPALFWTGPGKSSNTTPNHFKIASELTGVILIADVESSNNTANSLGHVKNSLTHAIELCSLDPKRLFFSGNSGGGARAFWNSQNYKAAGALPIVSYIPPGCKPPKKGYYYIVSGAYDYNRYTSSSAQKTLGSRAIHRLVPGYHSCDSKQAKSDGLIWLYSRNAYDVAEDVELYAFEDRFYKYLTEDLKDSPAMVYYWTDHMLNTCKMKGTNKRKFQDLHDMIENDNQNTRYLEARAALRKFSLKHLAQYGRGSKMGHTTKDILKAAEKLETKYSDVPELKQTIADLKKKTK